jgi:hypothetical protein
MQLRLNIVASKEGTGLVINTKTEQSVTGREKGWRWLGHVVMSQSKSLSSTILWSSNTYNHFLNVVPWIK